MAKNEAKVTIEPEKQEVFIVRDFDAPPELVYRAWVEPKLFVEWWGLRDRENLVDKLEPRNGGSWRFVSKDKKGKDDSFHGVFHEIVPSVRIIQTFEYEGLPETGHVVMEKVTFEPLPGNKTRLVIQNVFFSVADRDGMVSAGMEKGMRESHTRLDELLEKLKSSK